MAAIKTIRPPSRGFRDVRPAPQRADRHPRTVTLGPLTSLDEGRHYHHVLALRGVAMPETPVVALSALARLAQDT